MGKLAPQRLKTFAADDFGSAEVLELRGISAGFRTDPNKKFGSLQISIVIGRNIRHEICRTFQADNFSPQLQRGHSASPDKKALEMIVVSTFVQVPKTTKPRVNVRH